VQDLELRWCRLDGLEALSACLQLTRLASHGGPQEYYGGGLVDASEFAAFPASWSEGLRSLEWRWACSAGTLGWVEQLRGLTSLALSSVRVEPAFCRCALCQRADTPEL
jgi:hypothetical protein